MLQAEIGNLILDGLFAMNESQTKIVFPGYIYLGLLTKLPNNNGVAYDDGTYFSEPTNSEYERVRLDTTSRINKKKFLAAPQPGDPIEVGDHQDQYVPAYVTNQGLILFPEALSPWGQIVGFGLFRTNDKSDITTLPFLWGEVTADGDEPDVFINENEVPIIREGGFRVSIV